MAVFLEDYVDFLKGKVSPPGVDLFPDATDAQWLVRLQNAFWQATLEGTISGFTEDFGQVDPVVDGDDDIGRDLIQLIIVYAAIDSVRMLLANYDTTFRSKAGPVEYETGKSANLLNTILEGLEAEKARLLEQLAPIYTTSTHYFNVLEERDYNGRWDRYITDYS